MPKLFLFSDVHSNTAYCEKIVERAGEYDLVIGAGDFCIARRGLEVSTRILSQITVPAIFIPGNAESYEELQAAYAGHLNITILHGNSCEHLGYRFFGLGGGIPITPFGAWSYDLSEAQAAEHLNEAAGTDVLITHAPPKNVGDSDSRGRHLGSQAIYDFIQSYQPILHVCGHIHESWRSIAQIGATKTINAGPRGIPYTLSGRIDR